MSKNAFAAAAALSMMMAGSSAMAAGTSAGTAFDVQIVISDGCTISNDGGAVTFDSTIGVTKTKPATKTKSATIICTTGTTYDFHLSTPNNFLLKNTSDPTKTIGYEVKATLGGTTGNALGKTQVSSPTLFTGTGTGQTVTFTFDLTGWNTSTPDYLAGTYKDTVTLNVDF